METKGLGEIFENVAFQRLTQLFSLSEFERKLLGLCIAAAVDPETVRLLVEAHGQRYPTLAIAHELFDEVWQGPVLAMQKPLRYWELINVVHPSELAYTMGALRVNERILNYVQGGDYLDERLQAYLIPVAPRRAQGNIPSSHGALIDRIVRRLQTSESVQTLPFVQIVGADIETKHQLIQQIAAELDIFLYRLPAEIIPKTSQELDLFARLWSRECALSPVALLLDAHDIEGENPQEVIKRVKQFLWRTNGIVFLSTWDTWKINGAEMETYDVRKPTTAEQEKLWSNVLPESTTAVCQQLAAQFDLNMTTIERVAQHVDPDHTDLADLWQICLAQTRPQLDQLAKRVEVKAGWDDIVLPDLPLQQLKAISNQVSQRSVVYDEWGWRDRVNRGLGLTVVFSGESGTGKTFAAEVLANDLDLNLYHIDLSQVVSKYIGETEKNLRKLFDAAENGGVILFFDEADALFSQRGEARSSNDRYANMETNYLLQRLEAFKGLAILTTNLHGNMDEAFLRRMRFVVEFPLPTDQERERIWRKMFPAEMPTADLDFRYLSQFKMPGGAIYNVALNASFQAARLGRTAQMTDVLDMIRLEMTKMGRLPPERLLQWHG